MSTQTMAQPDRQNKTGHRPRPGKEMPRAAPIKRAPWEWYLPIYFWTGGVAAGGWLAATAEEWGGKGDREVVRTGRYLAFTGTMTGTALLILDLGRPERFLNMLRVVNPRSAMSLGSWGLTTFGTVAGGATALQLLEDLSRPRSRAERLARGAAGRTLQLIGLVPALFVGTYTGALLASTSTPAWARRRHILPLLFLASGTANGLAATMGIVEYWNQAPTDTRRRLASATSVALAADLALSLASERAIAGLPSQRKVPRDRRVIQRLALLAGTALPLALTAAHSRRLDRPEPRARLGKVARSRRNLLPIVASALALGGGLALRFRATHEGYLSAATPEDTWVHAQPGQKHPLPEPRREIPGVPTPRTMRTEPPRRRARQPRSVTEHSPSSRGSTQSG